MREEVQRENAPGDRSGGVEQRQPAPPPLRPPTRLTPPPEQQAAENREQPHHCERRPEQGQRDVKDRRAFQAALGKPVVQQQGQRQPAAKGVLRRPEQRGGVGTVLRELRPPLDVPPVPVEERQPVEQVDQTLAQRVHAGKPEENRRGDEDGVAAGSQAARAQHHQPQGGEHRAEEGGQRERLAGDVPTAAAQLTQEGGGQVKRRVVHQQHGAVARLVGDRPRTREQVAQEGVMLEPVTVARTPAARAGKPGQDRRRHGQQDQGPPGNPGGFILQRLAAERGLPPPPQACAHHRAGCHRQRQPQKAPEEDQQRQREEQQGSPAEETVEIGHW